MMRARSWLRERAPGYADLPPGDKEEITRFFWLWSFFEGTFARGEGDIRKTDALVGRWAAAKALDENDFAASLDYFADRYFPGGVESEHYEKLAVLVRHGARVDGRVRAVLTRENRDLVEIVRVLFIIVYRLRNNLVHGGKWAYQLSGQRSNFRHANRFLMRAMEIDGRGLL